MYYRSRITKKIVSFVTVLDDIYGNGTVQSMVRDGVLEEVEAPSVIDLIRDGTKTAAVLRYREIHGCGLAEAKAGVESLMKSMATYSTHRDNKQCVDKEDD